MKEWSNQWNPFNSVKLFAHVNRWRKFKSNHYPIPVLFTIDSTNLCNFNCVWCNSKSVRSESPYSLSKKAIDLVINAIIESWPGCEKFWLEAVCVAGGGEPFCNPYTSYLLECLHKNNIKVGIVTNGSILPDDLQQVLRCEWIGISVDAGTRKTFSQLKQVDLSMFNQVTMNISKLVKCSSDMDGYLSSGVTYKFLVHPLNIKEMYIATGIAKDLGCRQIHFRPVGVPWNVLGVNDTIFSASDLARYNDMIRLCFDKADESFGVFGQTHKFNSDFSVKHNFEKCYATYMTAVISPAKNKDEFTVGLCCDRRGDKLLELGTFKNAEDFCNAWGGKKHQAITNSINLKQCPRCTYNPHNEIYENVILKGKMNPDFI